jgi:hypothetical protein
MVANDDFDPGVDKCAVVGAPLREWNGGQFGSSVHNRNEDVTVGSGHAE